MIKNQQEYEITQEWIDKLQKSIADLECSTELKMHNPQKWQLNQEALHYQVEQLQSEIAEYESLTYAHPHQPIQVTVESLTKLPDVLIKARIAAQLTQEELASLLNIEPERIYDNEDSHYRECSFMEIVEVATVLGVSLQQAIMQVDLDEIQVIQSMKS
ncbi:MULTISPECIES: hypothetical protein [Roseofilum]|uniref:DNA-binding protein n=2 Tax=Roseofilum TaxID=1233426 RepID=A0ABT7B1X7_9CYAN|nr:MULTISPECIES: hypothetical protein [Roseofilum]MDJ1169709.1 DNA-binding protein [Roseofilum acuticapitatum BLCC-M154]MDJ1173175.1 DNA-binding protein [Roseofilum capinflatum BLCC-M114]